MDWLNDGLKNLDCSYNGIEDLSNLSSTLETIDFTYNPVFNLDNLSPNIIILNCTHTNMHCFGNLSTNIKYLEYSYNSIDDINPNFSDEFKEQFKKCETKVLKIINIEDKSIKVLPITT